MDKSMVESNEENARVFENSRMLSDTEFLEDTNRIRSQVVVYENPHNLEINTTGVDQKIMFFKGGTVSGVVKFQREDGKTAVLNFADGIMPGGCVFEGAKTQEENLCRCSNLYESLIQSEPMKKYYDYNHKQTPHVYSDRIIYTPGVAFFKQDVGYARMPTVYADVITCPSPSCSVKNEVLYNRIVGILKSARYNHITEIILGAWGCGAFGQDARVVGECFGRALNEMRYFRHVIFAVKCFDGDRNYTLLKNGFLNGYDFKNRG